LFDAAAVRALDGAAQRAGLPGAVLMARAGAAVVGEMQKRGRLSATSRVLVLCGPGQNGGDGWVAAAELARAGIHVDLLFMRAPADLRGDAQGAALAAASESGLHTRSLPDDVAEIAALPEWQGADVIVDALFGIGLERAPDTRSAALLAAAARCREDGAWVVAVDVPSGLVADDGRIPGAVLPADLTVTFGIDKLGLHVWPGAGVVGEIVIADIGYPADLMADLVPVAELATGIACPRRPADAHKGTQGSVLVAAGSAEMPGAAALAARAALRGGAGRVTVLSEALGLALVPAESMRRSAADRWCAADRAALREAAAGATAILVGPGLGADGAAAMCGMLAEWQDRRVVLDADALQPDLLPPAIGPRPWVLTPHPGEAARLLGCTVAAVQADRVAAARALAERYGAVVVLKGAGSLTAAPDGRLVVSPWSLPQLALPGSGDVLGGLLTALLAGGADPWDAAATAVEAHARAACNVLPGTLASELADALPPVLAP
jgi:NAD(P)H-hydrate epimerase